MKRKLLFISRKWPPAVGGMETHAVELAEVLKQRFDVTVLALPGRDDGRPPSVFKYIWFPVRIAIYCLLHGRKFDRLVLIDLLLFPCAMCSWLVHRRQRRIVIVYGLDLIYGTRKGLLPRLYRCYFLAFRACQRTFNHIVAISSYTAQLAESNGLAAVTVINPSLPRTPLTDAATNKIEELPANFANAQRRVLQFGRLVERKGALWFAENVLPALPNEVTMFVAGPPTDAHYLDALKTCDRVCYLGTVPGGTLATMIQTADVVVMPNIQSTPNAMDAEGFGQIAIETSAIGGILAAARLQGITDAVIDGVTGVLVEPGNAQAWQTTLENLFSESPDQRAQRRSVAQVQTRAYYSRERASGEFASLLEPI